MMTKEWMSVISKRPMRYSIILIFRLTNLHRGLFPMVEVVGEVCDVKVVVATSITVDIYNH